MQGHGWPFLFGRSTRIMEAMPLNWEQGALAEGLACYRRREFFDAHEHWEDVWRVTAEPERTFLQALIHIAAAFHHLERKNAVGAERQLRRSLRKLEPYPEKFGGVRVEEVRESVRMWLRAIEEGAADEMPFPPIG
jgi:uncharacterized protein